jgi:hypothetical protein
MSSKKVLFSGTSFRNRSEYLGNFNTFFNQLEACYLQTSLQATIQSKCTRPLIASQINIARWASHVGPPMMPIHRILLVEVDLEELVVFIATEILITAHRDVVRNSSPQWMVGGSDSFRENKKEAHAFSF